jgi:hypothetical protein
MQLEEATIGLTKGEINHAHVKGHQDQQRQKELSREAKMNVVADHLATVTLDEMAVHKEPEAAIPFPAAKCYLLHKGEIISSHETRTLIRLRHEKIIKQYIAYNNQWEEQVLDTINWTAYKRARAKSSMSMKKFVTKFTFGWLPTMETLHRRQQRCDNQCLCGQVETQQHLLQCREQQQQKETLIQELTKTLKDLGTKRILTNKIINNVSKWLDDKNGKLFGEQASLGIYALIRGYICNEWSDEQQRFYNDCDQLSNKKQTNKRTNELGTNGRQR